MYLTGFLLGIFFKGGGKIYCYANFYCYSIVFGPNFREGQKFSGGETASGGGAPWKKASLRCKQKDWYCFVTKTVQGKL